MGIEEHILAWRRHLGLTQEEFAKRAGIPRPNISDIERGKIDPTLSTVRRLSAALGISAGGLIDGWPPFPRLNRFQLDEMAKGPIKEKIMGQRLKALGIKGGRIRGKGEWALRALRADLGQAQLKALLARMEKHLA